MSLDTDLTNNHALFVALAATIKAGLEKNNHQNHKWIGDVFQSFKNLGLIHEYEIGNNVQTHGLNWLLFRERYPDYYGDRQVDMSYSCNITVKPALLGFWMILIVGIRKADGYIFFDTFKYDPTTKEESTIYYVEEVA
jgi:hypothetical protein